MRFSCEMCGTPTNPNTKYAIRDGKTLLVCEACQRRSDVIPAGVCFTCHRYGPLNEGRVYESHDGQGRPYSLWTCDECIQKEVKTRNHGRQAVKIKHRHIWTPGDEQTDFVKFCVMCGVERIIPLYGIPLGADQGRSGIIYCGGAPLISASVVYVDCQGKKSYKVPRCSGQWPEGLIMPWPDEYPKPWEDPTGAVAAVRMWDETTFKNMRKPSYVLTAEELQAYLKTGKLPQDK